MRLILRVAPYDQVVGAYHLEVKEKLSGFIYNLDLDKAESLLEELDPGVVSREVILSVELSLLRLYSIIKTQDSLAWLTFASERVIPFLEGKVVLA